MSAAQISQFKPARGLNTGDSDVSPNATPSQYLIIRGLESSVGEEILAKGVSKLLRCADKSQDSGEAPSKKAGAKVASTTSSANLGPPEGSILRVFIVRSRQSDESWRYGFAEFRTVEDAQAALLKYNSVDKFTISSRAVMVDYIHAGVFVPIIEARGANADKFTFRASANAALRLAYWDDEAYVCELPLVEPERHRQSKKDGHKGSGARAGGDRAVDASGADIEHEGKSKKRKAEAAGLVAKKTVPSHLQFWRDRHAEIHGETKKAGGAEASGSSAAEEQANAANASEAADDGDARAARSFADFNRKCCYLCSRQFKTVTEVKRHESLSALHKDNLGKDELRAKGLAKLVKAGLASSTGADETASEYRDRAKERRAAFGQPKKRPKNEADREGAPRDEGGGGDNVAAGAGGGSDTAVITSKGAALLGKMGWTAGEGLGAAGQGMAGPLATDLYAHGVGLGAEGGKVGDAIEEAGRNTQGGYDGFLERTRERAKERFERMSRVE